MSTGSSECVRQIDALLSVPHQMWLLGAGISRNAGIPLMRPLTARVASLLQPQNAQTFDAIREHLPEEAHVEHVLSQIGDLIAIGERSKTREVHLNSSVHSVEELRTLHAEIQRAIGQTVRFGFIPETDETPGATGTRDQPIVTIDGHIQFVRALFHHRRAGLERRPPVAFFTTNYDTLLEDALALCRIATSDGFIGGAMAFWDPNSAGRAFDQPFSPDGSCEAKMYKLHGSIDWCVSPEDIVVRRREGAGYPDETSARLLIYPQATKYVTVQRDPCASLFAAFRSALNAPHPAVLVVCGYSFGDDHVNEEIQRALMQRDNKVTLLAFVHESSGGDSPLNRLPTTLAEWLGPGSGAWKERVLVAGSRGIYHGSLENQCPAEYDAPHPWWSFDGVTNLLRHGPEPSA